MIISFSFFARHAFQNKLPAKIWVRCTMQSFSSTFNIFGRGKPKTYRSERNDKFAHALIKYVPQKLQRKLVEEWYTVQWCQKLLQCVAESRREINSLERYVQRSRKKKKATTKPKYYDTTRCDTTQWQICTMTYLTAVTRMLCAFSIITELASIVFIISKGI